MARNRAHFVRLGSDDPYYNGDSQYGTHDSLRSDTRVMSQKEEQRVARQLGREYYALASDYVKERLPKYGSIKAKSGGVYVRKRNGSDTRLFANFGEK